MKAYRTRPDETAFPRKASGHKILIVEDNDAYRQAVSMLLEEMGYEVHQASNGVEGLQAAQELLPDLILLDFNMPRMNGYELVQELRRSTETRGVPAIMFTGASNRQHLRTLMPELRDFLHKPMSPSRLVNAVQRVLGQELSKLDDSAILLEAPSAPAPEEFKPESFEEDDLTVADEDSDGKTEAGLEILANDSPLVARVNKILIGAVNMGASDIHIEPQEKELLVRVRVNGSLQKLCAMPLSIQSRLAARIKIMANLVITERRHPQDGQIRAILRGRKVEFRVSTIPGLHGEKIVLRVLGGGKVKDSVAELGMNARDLDCVAQAIRMPHGLILVTGPTGSGKSTTLYTMIKVLNRPDVNIMTAEDPVEYEMPGITQIPVRAKIGLTFESVLRSFLRQDPDIMLIGEIRDFETAEIAVKASITGHVVFSTLHTNSAPATVMRMVHMGVAPYLVAASVQLVVAQRLVKTLCSSCRAPAELEDHHKRLLTESELARLSTAYSPVGCVECQDTGYRGRIPLFEVMPLRSSEMRRRVLAGAEDIFAQAVGEGMTSLRQSALNAVGDGRTSFAEAFKVIAAE